MTLYILISIMWAIVGIVSWFNNYPLAAKLVITFAVISIIFNQINFILLN